MGWERNDHERGDDELKASVGARAAPLGPQERPGNCGDYSCKCSGKGCRTDGQDAGSASCVGNMMPAPPNQMAL